MNAPARVRIHRGRSNLLAQFPIPDRTGTGASVDTMRSVHTGGLTVYLLEHVMPGLTSSDVEATQHALNDATRRITLEGLPVRCLRASYVPSQHRWICLVVSRSAESVRRIGELAQFSYPRISEVMVLGTRNSEPGHELHGTRPRFAW